MAYDGGRVETRDSFTEKQIAEALIAQFGLPKDASAVFVVEKELDRYDNETGSSVTVQITYKRAIKPIGD